MTTKITVDGTEYNVRLKYETLTRAFSIVEGDNAGEALSGRLLRDVIGTKYSYQIDIEPDPSDPDSYDSFFQTITAPADYHTVTMPYGQSTITFDAAIQSGSDIYRGKLGNKQRWSGLSIQFIAMAPQRA